jgi:hypothetical protein
VKRSNDGSGCPDGRVESFGRPFFLSGQACFCDLLRGTTFERHLSSVWTVNSVGYIALPSALQPSHSPFWFFLSSCTFFLCFL